MCIDFHSHILPGIDDGSKNTAQSAAMLEGSAGLGVRVIAATPHFDPLNSNIGEFLAKREKSLEILKDELALRGAGAGTGILRGAECLYVRNISRFPDLEKLCLEGTSYLLLELPYGKWEDDIFEEIYLLNLIRGIYIMIAHPDRFLRQIRESGAVDKFSELECILQINADSLTGLFGRKPVLELAASTVPCVLGSDMHDDGSGFQPIPRAIETIEKKLGANVRRRISEASEAVLKNTQPSLIRFSPESVGNEI